jgi:divalent metal cation (Fe/Co/Zn/Cd) transporter
MLWTNHSVLELVDAAIPEEDLYPIKQTILQVQGVQVGIGILFL